MTFRCHAGRVRNAGPDASRMEPIPLLLSLLLLWVAGCASTDDIPRPLLPGGGGPLPKIDVVRHPRLIVVSPPPVPFAEPTVLLTVVDPRKRPLADACVCLVDSGGCGRTSREGAVLLAVPRDSAPIRITASLPGYGPGYVLLRRASGRLNATLPLDTIPPRVPSDAIAPHPTSHLRGRIVDAAGEPIPRATIRIVDTRLGALSTPNGEFQVRGIRAGDYEIEVAATGFRKERMRVRLAADTGATCLVQLRERDMEEIRHPIRVECIREPVDIQLRRDQVTTTRTHSPEADPRLPSRSLQESIRPLSSIRHTDPDGAPR